jgi:hypothetical protein
LSLRVLREDLGESIDDLIEALLRSAVRQRTPEDPDGMLSEQQRIDDTVQAARVRRALSPAGLYRPASSVEVLPASPPAWGCQEDISTLLKGDIITLLPHRRAADPALAKSSVDKA